MNRDTIHDGRSDARIDNALRSVGAVTPDTGFQGRILSRLAAERIARPARPPVFIRLFATGRMPRFPRAALGLGTACVLGFGIVAGSVSHSRRAGHGVLPPPLPLSGQGLGAASAMHPAAPASTPAPAGVSGRASQPSPDKGRAEIQPHSHKAPGVVPAPPVNRKANESHK
jgi:hypothetical protein